MTPISTNRPVELETPAQRRLNDAIIAKLRGVSILASLTEDRLHCLDGAIPVHLDADQIVINQGEIVRVFCILLEGSIRVINTPPAGIEQTVSILEPGAAFGEVPLLANIPSTATLRAQEPCELLQLDEDQFWHLMTECPEVRKAILGNMALRLAKIQNTTFQQEKMAALGTLAAGLMHELNNPGAAARRASSQLRENLVRLHQLGQRFTGVSFTPGQKECLLELSSYAFNDRPESTLSSLEQSDAEEAMREWLESSHTENAWKLAPTLVAVGLKQEDLGCARGEFTPEIFSDALNWLEALVSSQQLVSTIEESITRVTDLVAAVKTYAYEGKGQKHPIDVNKSIYATIVILLHKIREKQIVFVKEFSPDLPLLAAQCQGINQVWTNLLDNAIDALPYSGRIRLRTWSESRESSDPTTSANNQPSTQICILVEDNGPGIPLECQSQIFDPFFTTKPVGVGTGLGLGIVFRIVEECGGSIHFTSTPGSTQFVVRLPAA